MTYGTPDGCEAVIAQNEDYLRCMQGFSSLFSDVGDDQNATNYVFCSAEGRAAVSCVLDYYISCPHLLAGEEAGNKVDEIMSLIQVSGKVDVYCKVLEEGCLNQFKQCTNPLNIHTEGGDIFKKTSSSGSSDSTNKDQSSAYESGPKLYGTIPAQIEILCGPMENIMSCTFNASDKCPEMKKKVKQILNDRIEAQRTKWWQNFPDYSDAEKYIRAKCPTLPSDFSSKRACLEESVNQTGFVECFKNATEMTKTECGEFTLGKTCITNHVSRECGKDYAAVLVESSYLFSDNIPKDCQAVAVSSVSKLQASVLTMIAGLLTVI